MKPSSSGEQGLARYRSPFAYRMFDFVFSALFFIVVLITIFSNRQTFYPFTVPALLLFAVLGTAGVWLGGRLFALLPDFSPCRERMAVALCLLAFVGVQLVLGWQLRVQPRDTWDFGIVYGFARGYVLQGTLPDDYFLYFTNNAGLYTLWCAFFSLLHLFGATDFTFPAMVLNILAIDGALLLLYFCARRLLGVRQALFALLAAFSTLPFVAYVPVFYTDTLTLPFPIACVLLWLHARDAYREGQNHRALLLFCILSAVTALGALLKITVLIVWLAVALDLLILLRGRGRLPVLGAGALVLAVLFLGIRFFIAHSPLLPNYDYGKGLPFTHWIMMGLQGDGGYWDPDYQLTLTAQDKSARYSLTVNEIQARLQEMGPGGLTRHLRDKLSYTFGDGTYTSADKLDRSPYAVTFFHKLFVPSGTRFSLLAYYAFAVEAGTLVWMAVGALRAFCKSESGLVFLRMALFGLTLFLLLWETRARYLVNYLPLFLLCAVGGAAVPWPGQKTITP